MSKARDILKKDRDFILWLFNNRCVKCGRPTIVIHEIVPISHGKSALHWANRVPLCVTCHDWAHAVGTNKSIPILQAKRVQFLKIRYENIDWKEVSERLGRDIDTESIEQD